MADSYQPTYWVDKSTPSLNAANLRKLEKGIADAHGIADGTIGSTGAVDRIVINDGAGHYLQIPSLTTAERDALTAANGAIIYNNTLKCLQARRDGAWVDLHAGVIRADLNMGGKKITSVGAPTADADAATKQYVDLRPASSAIVANAYLSGSSWYRTDPAKPAWRVEVDANTDLCRYLRAPAGSGAIAWTDVYQVGPRGPRPHICVASNEIRYTAPPSTVSGYRDFGTYTLISKRVPAGAPYYGAGYHQMSVRITARLESYTPDPYHQGSTITFRLYVDNVEKWTGTASTGNPGDLSVDVPINPYSLIEIKSDPASAYNAALYFGVYDFCIGASDTVADSTGWE
jgi:hypothetical protein